MGAWSWLIPCWRTISLTVVFKIGLVMKLKSECIARKGVKNFLSLVMVNGWGVDGSWLVSVLANDSYASLRFAPFILFGLNYGAQNGRLACCHCCRKLRYMNRLSVGWGFNHRIEDLYLVLGLTRGWYTCVLL